MSALTLLQQLITIFKSDRSAVTQCKNTTSIIFIAPPTKSNEYYKKFTRSLYDFYADFLNKVNSNNSDKNEYILCIVDEYGKKQLLNRGINESNIFLNNINYEMEDIWIRDFGTIQIDDTLYKFIYKPKYIKINDAMYIDKQYRKWLKHNKIKYVNVNIILDGGNFVFERKTKRLIVTERILTDNPSFNNNKTKMIEYLKKTLNINEIAIIPQEPMEITGHSDGMITFINDNIIGINDYSKYNEQKHLYYDIIDCLNDAFGSNNINIVNLPYNPTLESYKQFASSKGIYTNILNGLYTKYVPIYNQQHGDDQLNIDLLNKYSDKNISVQGINAADIAILGGSVRCLSWYIWGKPADDFIANHNIKQKENVF